MYDCRVIKWSKKSLFRVTGVSFQINLDYLWLLKRKPSHNFVSFQRHFLKLKGSNENVHFYLSNKDLLFVIHSCTDAVLETKTNRVRSSVENLKEPRICQRDMRNCCWVKRERLQLDKGTVLSKTWRSLFILAYFNNFTLSQDHSCFEPLWTRVVLCK